MKSSLLPPTDRGCTPTPYLHQNILSTAPTNAPPTERRRFLCTTGVCKWIYYHTDTASYVLTHHSGGCRPGRTAPLEPSISPGDDPEDTDRRKGQLKSRQNPLKDASQSLLTEFYPRLENPIMAGQGQYVYKELGNEA